MAFIPYQNKEFRLFFVEKKSLFQVFNITEESPKQEYRRRRLKAIFINH